MLRYARSTVCVCKARREGDLVILLRQVDESRVCYAPNTKAIPILSRDSGVAATEVHQGHAQTLARSVYVNTSYDGSYASHFATDQSRACGVL